MLRVRIPAFAHDVVTLVGAVHPVAYFGKQSRIDVCAPRARNAMHRPDGVRLAVGFELLEVFDGDVAVVGRYGVIIAVLDILERDCGERFGMCAVLVHPIRRMCDVIRDVVVGGEHHLVYLVAVLVEEGDEIADVFFGVWHVERALRIAEVVLRVYD